MGPGVGCRATLPSAASPSRTCARRRLAGVVDEIPAAYKDLESVVEAQAAGPSPLLEVVHRLTTLLCIKG